MSTEQTEQTEQTTSEKMTKWCDDVYDALLSDDRAGLSKLFKNLSGESKDYIQDTLYTVDNKMGEAIYEFVNKPSCSDRSWETEGVSEETRQIASDHVKNMWNILTKDEPKCKCPDGCCGHSS